MTYTLSQEEREWMDAPMGPIGNTEMDPDEVAWMNAPMGPRAVVRPATRWEQFRLWWRRVTAWGRR